MGKDDEASKGVFVEDAPDFVGAHVGKIAELLRRQRHRVGLPFNGAIVPSDFGVRYAAGHIVEDGRQSTF